MFLLGLAFLVCLPQAPAVPNTPDIVRAAEEGNSRNVEDLLSKGANLLARDGRLTRIQTDV
jgi:hypothetical protein